MPSRKIGRMISTSSPSVTMSAASLALSRRASRRCSGSLARARSWPAKTASRKGSDIQASSPSAVSSSVTKQSREIRDWKVSDTAEHSERGADEPCRGGDGGATIRLELVQELGERGKDLGRDGVAAFEGLQLALQARAGQQRLEPAGARVAQDRIGQAMAHEERQPRPRGGERLPFRLVDQVARKDDRAHRAARRAQGAIEGEHGA